MSLTKRNIMLAAIRLFSEKGFRAASIQDIADDCGISKGSLYKFFPSKEVLFIEILSYRQTVMFEDIAEIVKDASLDRRDLFLREIRFQFDFFLKDRFLMQQIKEFKDDGNREAAACMHHVKSQLTQYYRDCLLRAYGPDIEPWLWDLVVLFGGLLREYVFMVAFQNIPIDIYRLVGFVAERMDDIVAGLKARAAKPLVSEAMLKEWLCQPGGLRDSSFSPAALTEHLLSTIAELPVTMHRRNELRDAALLLRSESDAAEPRRFLLRSLVRFLEEEHELKAIVARLEPVLMASGGRQPAAR